jgi:hypothetical protein
MITSYVDLAMSLYDAAAVLILHRMNCRLSECFQAFLRTDGNLAPTTSTTAAAMMMMMMMINNLLSTDLPCAVRTQSDIRKVNF